MQKYKHIFFDLDRTLWDFDSNSAQTLLEILEHFSLQAYVRNSERWTSTYKECNEWVWKLFEEKKLNKQELRIERFKLLFEEFKINREELIPEISEYYIANSPAKPALMPNVTEVLDYLRPKYTMYIVSNGFYDIQLIKLKAGNIDTYFKRIITSDKVWAAKPHRKIFEEAVKSANARKSQSIFIGDNLTRDIIGAKKFGVDQIWYNHDNILSDIKPSFEIRNLMELKNIL